MPFSVGDDRLTLLGSVPLFQGLSKRELRDLERAGGEVEIEAGWKMVEEGSFAIDFYLVLEGQATVTVRGRRAGTLGPGDYFGEIAVLDSGLRTATVTADTPMVAFRVGRPDFVGLLDRQGSIARKILIEMCRRLRQAEGSGGRY